MSATVEYRLLSMEFRGMKPRAMFNGATMVHDGIMVKIENLRTPHQKVVDYLLAIDCRELKTIRYLIIARDPRSGRRIGAAVPFCHPFPRGTGVQLGLLYPGELALQRNVNTRGSRKFFSSNFRLPDVMNNPQLPNQPAFQFHE